MPAAAVIPAPIAYINVVAVKTLVVVFLALESPPTAPVSLHGGTGVVSGALRPSFVENVLALH